MFTHTIPELSIDDFIESQNIELFKARLETETDPVTRATLIKLLSAEEAKHLTRRRLDLSRLAPCPLPD